MLKYFRDRESRRRRELADTIRHEFNAQTAKLQTQLADLNAKHAATTQALAEVRRERDTLKARLRDETEAVMVLAALRVAAKAIMGTPRDVALEADLRSAQGEWRSLQQYTPPFPGGVLQGGLGAVLAQQLGLRSQH